METIDFGDAIKALKLGKKVQRKGWNGKNQYVRLGTNIAFLDPENNVVSAFHKDVGSKALIFYGTSGTQVGWLASQSDMLADDWVILE